MWCISRIDRQLNSTNTRPTSKQTVLSCVIVLNWNFYIKFKFCGRLTGHFLLETTPTASAVWAKTISSRPARTHVLPRSKHFCHVYSCLTKIFKSKKLRADAWLNILSWRTHHEDVLYEQKRSGIRQHKHTFHLGPNGSVMCFSAGQKLSYQI